MVSLPLAHTVVGCGSLLRALWMYMTQSVWHSYLSQLGLNHYFNKSLIKATKEISNLKDYSHEGIMDEQGDVGGDVWKGWFYLFILATQQHNDINITK